MPQVQQLSDEELMKAYQQGDDLAFKELYARHSAKVYGYLMNSLKSRAVADDVFQATFLKLHKSRTHYDPSFPFVPWLFTVCKSVMLDHVRKAKTIKEDRDDVALAQAEASPVAESDAALPDLSALPEPQRKALELRYGKELSFDEIARTLETSPANVRQLVSRAIKRLRAGRLAGGQNE